MRNPVSRRRFLLGQAGGDGLDTDGYREWIFQYRSGRFVETAGRVRNHPARELRRAQSGFLRPLPRPDAPAGFGPRLAAALLHAEAVAHFGLGPHVHLRLVLDPLESLPRRWPPGVPGRPATRAAWGEAGASDIRALLRRELLLAAARMRLAIFDLAGAARILAGAESAGDPALRWQLAGVRAVRARYLGEAELWPEVGRAFRRATSAELLRPGEGRASPRAVARAMTDPDDLNLRLALAALGRGRGPEAARSLARVSGEPAERLLVPKLLLAGELRFAEGRLSRAISDLRQAVALAPASQAAATALAMALGAAGQWDEAAELATGALRVPRTTAPWTDFLLTWAEPREPGLEWLRSLARR